MMNIQRSFSENKKGALYVVPTPIGNLEDITFRALKKLTECSWIAAEDTRKTKQLLHHFEIKKSVISYHEHNKRKRIKEILHDLKQGKTIALVSDAGMPAISDPGADLIQRTIVEDIPVIVLPGANAALCAVVGSGLSTDEFLFYGFLPRQRQEKAKELKRLASLPATLIFYESPHRIKDTLKALLNQLGDRHIAVARELTKRYEEYVRGKTSEVLKELEAREIKGEICLVVEGGQEEGKKIDTLWWSHFSVVEHVEYYVEQESMSNRDAIQRVAEERKLSKNQVYQMFHHK